MYYASSCKHVMVSLQEVTMHVHACINSQKLKKKKFKDRNTLINFKDFKIST